MLITPHLDILRRYTDGTYVWLEAVYDLESAKARIRVLSVLSPGEYFVFDQKSQKVVANTGDHSLGS